jgi:hypothetical protein
MFNLITNNLIRKMEIYTVKHLKIDRIEIYLFIVL